MDIIKRAMLGDKKAQEEITARGELLPCPHCNSPARHGLNKKDSRKRFGVYHIIATTECSICTAKVTMAGTDREKAYKYADELWNTRPQLLTDEEMERLEQTCRN